VVREQCAVDLHCFTAYCFHQQDCHDDAVRASETSLNIYLTTRQYIGKWSRCKGRLVRPHHLGLFQK
jgi:hypothetical protein